MAKAKKKYFQTIDEILAIHPHIDPPTAVFCIEYSKDLDHRRAAEMAGVDPDKGRLWKNDENIQKVVNEIIIRRLNNEVAIDARFVLDAAVDLYRACLMDKKYSTAKQVLDLIARHNQVDAMSAEKVEIVETDELKARLTRARQNARKLEELKKKVH